MGDEFKTINGLFEKQLISARLSKDYIELIDENFELITGISEPGKISDRKLVECLVDLALSKSKPKKENQLLISQLQAEITRLTEENSNLGNSINALKVQHEQEIEDIKAQAESIQPDTSEIDRLKALTEIQRKTISDMKEEIVVLRTPKNNDNSVIIVISDGEKNVIAELCKNESKATGKNVTPDMLFKTMFSHILIYGPHDMFNSVISDSRIRELMTKKPPTPPEAH